MASTGMAPVIGQLPASDATYGLFDALRPLPSDPVLDERWPMHGVKFQPRPCRGAYRSDSDCNPTDHTTDAPACEAWVEQLPFRIYDVLQASTFDWNLVDMEAQMAERMSSIASNLFAQELLDASGSGGLSLSSVATDPADVAFGSAAVKLSRAVAVLENELASRLRGRAGMIHMPPGMLTQAVATLDLVFTDGRWLTPNGNVVVVDSGYVNATQPSGEAAAAATADWVYASGEVFYLSTTPQFIGTAGQALNRSINEVRRFIEGFGMLVFDPCPVTAILTAYNDIA